MRSWMTLLPALILLLACHPATPPGPEWKPCAWLENPEIDECSGIVSSRAHADVFWVHNDSGDLPRLFAVDRAGRLLREVRVQGARNVDWEDLTTDDAGHLYIGDFGNNKNERRDLSVYVIAEPDPRSPGAAVLVVPVLRRIPFHFPEQRGFPDPDRLNYDCEAMFWEQGSLYVLTKHRSDMRTVLYRLPAGSASSLPARRVGEFEIGSPVTSAALSADGRYLVVLSYQYIHVFERPKGAADFLGGTNHRVLIEGRQCEGICFDGEDVVFTNEQREVYCLALADLVGRSAYLPTPPRLRLPRVAPELDGRAAEWGTAPPVALRLEPPEQGAVTPPPPALRLGWCAAGLLVHATWPLAPDTAPTGETLLYLMCGPPGDVLPQLQSGQWVWEARWLPSGVEFRPILPAPGKALAALVVQQSETELALEVLVPVDLVAGADLALNVILLEARPSAREWAWAGSSSTQPLENPLLWGRVDLDP